MIRVRLFAAAAEAVASKELTLVAATIGEVRELLAARSAEAPRVLAQCAMLRDGDRLEDDARLASGDLVDVLPPFAGG